MTQSSLRIVSWNVRQGGKPEAIVEVLDELGADVVIIGEHRASGRLAALLAARRWSHQLGDADPDGGYAGLLMASSLPLTAIGPTLGGPDSHRFVLASVADTGWELAGCYIPGSDSGTRKAEYWRFLNTEFHAACSRRRVLLVGDLNTGLHGRDEQGANFVQAAAMAEFEGHGWRNVFGELHPDDPVPPTYWHSSGSAFRLDHAYLSPAAPPATRIGHPVASPSGTALAGVGAVSDHLPVVVDIPVPVRVVDPSTAVYLTNELGDIYAVVDGGRPREIDPRAWGWVKPGGHHDRSEFRMPVGWLESLPGFTVVEGVGEGFTPGPRTPKTIWGQFSDGAAPPAAVRSKAGDGTLSYMDRLSEAVAYVGQELPANPGRSPMIIHDYVEARRFAVTYVLPAVGPPGTGTVYFLDDGMGVKIGFTSGPVAKRIAALQTGNPRPIRPIAEIGGSTQHLEDELHTRFKEHNISGEWYDRGHMMRLAQAAGGFHPMLTALVPSTCPLAVHLPYR